MLAQLTILGSGAALPTQRNFPSSQILTLRDKQYMIDCGEGTQIRIRQMKLRVNRMGHVFLSHLHGDHCLGLIGLISSLAMLNRTADMYIHGPIGTQQVFESQLKFFCADIPFEVFFVEHDTHKHTLIYEDRSVEVYSIPLKHRVPCCGFLFVEKPSERHIIRDMIDYYQIPISQINLIKKGADFITEEGIVIPNSKLTSDPNPSISYAYCSDTAYSEQIIPIIKGVDLLYHEATFAQSEELRAHKTMHSTAKEAAQIAHQAEVKKLIIGHFSARYRNQEVLLNEARSVFKSTELAEDMMVVDI